MYRFVDFSVICGLFSSSPGMFMSVLMYCSHTVPSCSFVIDFEIKKYEFFNFVLFQDCLGCSRSIAFLYEFQDQLLMQRKAIRISVRITLTRQVNLRNFAIIIVSLPHSQTWDVFPLIRVFTCFQQYFVVFSVQVLYFFGYIYS